MTKTVSNRDSKTNHFDIIVIGAGLGGLYTLHKMLGQGYNVIAVEQGKRIGGTWFWNQYPGCRCDVESLEYSYSFSEELQQEWHWPEKYSKQTDILKYINHVADRFSLKQKIVLNTKIIDARYDQIDNIWRLRSSKNDSYSCDFCIMATGNLSVPNPPKFPRLEEFRGDSYHTGLWPSKHIDFSNKRVGLIGTGSSGVQASTEIAKNAKHLYVFQRTANFSLPARNKPSDPRTVEAHKREYEKKRQAAFATPFGISGYPPPTKSALEVNDQIRNQIFEEKWLEGGTISFLYSFTDLLTNQTANDYASEFVRKKIRKIVKDPKTAELLCPHSHPIGTKRLILDSGYYDMFNQDNVQLIDIKNNPITGFTENGIIVKAKEYLLDAIVFATGFDAMTGALHNIDIYNHRGISLKQKWKEGPLTYLGLMTADFPNFFMITGPQSPGVKSNMILSIEQHVNWVAQCLETMRKSGKRTINAKETSEKSWVNHCKEVADKTLYPLGNSWYQGANIPGKKKVFMPYIGGVQKYKNICDEIVRQGYPGFHLS